MNLELGPEMVSDFSSLHCKRQSTGCLCLFVLSRFFCEEAKPVGFFWLTCFYSFLVCFYSHEFAKLLHPVLNWVGSQKCPEWFCFWKWGYREIRWFWGHIFLFLSGSWKLIILVCVCVCVCVYVCMPSCFSSVQLFANLWTVARQAPLSMGILQTRILEWVAMPSSRG